MVWQFWGRAAEASWTEKSRALFLCGKHRIKGVSARATYGPCSTHCLSFSELSRTINLSPMSSLSHHFIMFCGFLLLAFSMEAVPLRAQESPYMVTYDHYLEEPGSLEIEYFSTFGTQRAGNDFHAFWTEFEYGATAWWTTELYLDGQSTFDDSTIFTGFRLENRFRPLQHEHFINPVLYIEYEQISEADKIVKEVEGHDVEADHAVPNAIARQDHDYELEFKLLLSGNFKGWNIAENTIATKNLTGADPWEFGYAIGTSRPLALKASAKPCSLCRENFAGGIEMYGGLGDRYSFGLPDTSHYLAPVAIWNSPSNWAVRVSPGFGLNHNSHRFLLRWGLSREFPGFGATLARWLGDHS